MSRPDDDTAWREIIANYGERVLGPEDEVRVAEPPTEPAPAPRPATPEDREPQPQPEPQRPDHPELADIGHEERFVPPPPPPLPRVSKDRLAAWLGVFVSPVILLVATVLRLSLPTMVAWLLVGAFLGGFGYLVSQMPRGPRDPYDDGAVL